MTAMRCTRRGAANPRVLAMLIIAGGLVGGSLLYLFEPWLIPVIVETEEPGRPRAENAIPDAEIAAAVLLIKAEIAGLVLACAPTADAFAGGIAPLVAELIPSGEGFACYPVEPAKYALQERYPRIVELRDWLRDNARRADDPEMRGRLVRLLADFEGLIKSIDRVILGYQSYQSASFPKQAETALRKFEPIWRGHASLVERLAKFVDERL